MWRECRANWFTSMSATRWFELRVNPVHMAGVVQRLTDEGMEFEYGGDSLYFYGDSSAVLNENGSLNGYEMFQRPGNLEDLFLRLTGRGLREG